jgi:formylglycine-generating enzyme required for sulfatase activity
MRKIFISYRRKRTADIAGRIADWLKRHFGADAVFIDVETIPPGAAFKEYIKDWLDQCNVMLVVIGDSWLTATDEQGQRRIDADGDAVRFELEEAIARHIPLLPVLVQDAPMPRAHHLPASIRSLTDINAVTVSSGRDFEQHLADLIAAIEQLLARPRERFKRDAKREITLRGQRAKVPALSMPRDGDTMPVHRSPVRREPILNGETVLVTLPRSGQPATHEAQRLMAALDWLEVPAGSVTLLLPRGPHLWDVEAHLCAVERFSLSSTLITNAQYAAFAAAPDGYRDLRWWQFSAQALAWRQKNPAPVRSAFQGDDLPRVNVCWFEAMAFCFWMSAATGALVRLPSEAQWQRGGQANDQREFPWGNTFDLSRAQTHESGAAQPAPVTAFRNGRSHFGAYDMAGNAQQWCLTEYSTGSNASLEGNSARSVRGGSWRAKATRLTQRHKHTPDSRLDTIGFRVVMLPKH